jgi:hypothetical protein
VPWSPVLTELPTTLERKNIVPKDKFAEHLERAERNRVLNTLFRLGFHQQDIPALTGYSHSIVRRTFAGLRKTFGSGSSEPPHQLFARQLSVYVSMANPDKIYLSKDDAIVMRALERHLGILRLNHEAELIASGIKLQCFPADYPFERKLLNDVLQDPDPNMKDVEHLSGRRLVVEYVGYLNAVGDPMPQRRDLLTAMQAWALRKYRNEFRLQMFPVCLDLIERVLGILSARKREVIHKRYGLIDGKPLTVEQCAAKMNIRPSDVRRYERKALADLRKPENRRRLKWLVEEPRLIFASLVNRVMNGIENATIVAA